MSYSDISGKHALKLFQYYGYWGVGGYIQILWQL